MKVLVEIEDNKADFGIKVLQALSFVRKAKPLSVAKAGVLDALKEASAEVSMHKRGKIKLKTAQELLNTL